MPKVVVTGSCGLIGSEVSRFFARQGFQIHGIDDNHRAVFFGPEGDTSWVLERLRKDIPGYHHAALDIRDREGVLALAERSAAGLDHPHRRAAFPRPRRRHSISRFRSQCAGHAASSGSSPPVLSRIAFHPHVDQQGLRRPAQCHCAAGTGQRAGTMPTRRSSTAFRRTFPSIRASIPFSARPKWPATSWCRNTAAISICPPAACAAAA